jgi:hypothetical protein
MFSSIKIMFGTDRTEWPDDNYKRPQKQEREGTETKDGLERMIYLTRTFAPLTLCGCFLAL